MVAVHFWICLCHLRAGAILVVSRSRPRRISVSVYFNRFGKVLLSLLQFGLLSRGCGQMAARFRVELAKQTDHRIHRRISHVISSSVRTTHERLRRRLQASESSLILGTK